MHAHRMSAAPYGQCLYTYGFEILHDPWNVNRLVQKDFVSIVMVKDDGGGHVCHHVMHATALMHNICMGRCTNAVA